MRRSAPLLIALLLVATSAAPALAATATSTESETGTETGTETETPAPTGDGELVIGTWLPSSGSDRAWSAAQRAAAELAVRDLNAAGGVLGQPVRLHHRDSGRAPEDADGLAALDELIALGADVVLVGDAALVAPVLPRLEEAGVLAVSASTEQLPASIAGGALLSTMPGLGAEARAVAALVPGDAVILTASPTRGAAFAAALALGAEAGGPRILTVTALPEPTAVGELAEDETALAADAAARSEAVSGVLASLGEATLVLDPASTADAAPLVAAVLEGGLDPAQLVLASTGFTNLGSAVEAGALDGALAVRPGTQAPEEFARRLAESDPRLDTTVAAAEAYDAITLVGVAAQQGGDDAGAAILATVLATPAATTIACGSASECAAILADGQVVHYVGASGPLDYSAAGLLRTGSAAVAGFVGQSRPVIEQVIVVGTAPAIAQADPSSTD